MECFLKPVFFFRLLKRISHFWGIRILSVVSFFCFWTNSQGEQNTLNLSVANMEEILFVYGLATVRRMIASQNGSIMIYLPLLWSWTCSWNPNDPYSLEDFFPIKMVKEGQPPQKWRLRRGSNGWTWLPTCLTRDKSPRFDSWLQIYPFPVDSCLTLCHLPIDLP